MKKLAVLFLILFGIILAGAGLIENEFITKRLRYRCIVMGCVYGDIGMGQRQCIRSVY